MKTLLKCDLSLNQLDGKLTKFSSNPLYIIYILATKLQGPSHTEGKGVRLTWANTSKP